MMRFAAVYAILTIPLCGVFAEETDSPKIGKSFIPDSIRFVTATSEDREVSTILFDNFVLATSHGKGELVEAQTRSLTLANRIEAQDDVAVTLDIRGFVAAEAGGSAALIVHVGGETILVDLNKSTAAAASKSRSSEDKLLAAAMESADAAGFTVDSRPKVSEDYMARVTARLQKGQPLQATVLLLVDRLTSADSQAMITVDTIDVSVKAAPAEKKKPETSPEVTKSEKTTAEKTIAKAAEKPVKSEKKESPSSDDEEKPATKKSSEKKTESRKTSGDSKSES